MTQQDRIVATPPGVVLWFKIYAGFQCFLYGLCILAGIVFLLLPSMVVLNDPDFPPLYAYICGTVIIGIGTVFLAAFLVSFFLKPRPWTWAYDLVMICLGLMSGMFPFSIILLVFWLQPNTKQYFGKVN